MTTSPPAPRRRIPDEGPLRCWSSTTSGRRSTSSPTCSRRDPRVGEVHGTDSPTEALRLLRQLEVDAVFLDVQMPGLSGIELAQVLARFRHPPPIVFVTAHEEHAVDAFDLDAVDYVLKPVRAQRLAEAVRRVVATAAPSTPPPASPRGADAGRARRRHPLRPVSRIRHVEAQGDYARLHTDGDSHLVRVPLTQLEQDWAAGGFVRIHRSRLVTPPTSRSCASTPAAARWSSAAPTCRSAGATPASCATCWSADARPGAARPQPSSDEAAP